MTPRLPFAVALLLSTATAHAGDDDSTAAFDVYRDRHGDLTNGEVQAKLPKPDRVKLGFDPTEADYFDKIAKELQLGADERKIYRDNGLVSVDHGVRYSFGASYYAIYARDLPVFITSDSIMHAVHKSYDSILMQLEGLYLAPTIDEVLTKAHARVEKGDEDLDLYFTVARNLLAGAHHEKLAVPAKLGTEEAVKAILDKVERLVSETPRGPQTTMFGGKRPVDYSQFEPRGHYTKTEELKRYFRAMMWLGRADTGFEIAEDRQLRSAIRLVKLLEASEGLEKLKAMNEIIDFMVGPSDNLTVFGLHDATRAETKPVAVRKHLAKNAAAQKIRSQIVVSNPDDTVEVPPPELFQMFGQRFVIDSFVLSKVVFDSILFGGKKVKRMMPQGLDVAGALGSDEAIRILGPELESLPYGANLLAARDYVDAQPSGFWKQNVYNSWLAALRTLDDRPANAKHFPRVMRSAAWDRKQLQTQLGSWAELRHDTILYAKQSYTAWPSCEYPTGYVEPYPEFYGAVKALAEEAARRIRLADYGRQARLKTAQIAYFEKLGETMARLAAIANRELAAQPLTSDDEDWLKKTIDRRGGGSGPPRYDGWYPTLFYEGGVQASKWDPTIADVHTDPKSGRVREVGVGDVNFLVIAIDNEGDRTAYVGPVYSYYEFDQPQSDRLTDEQWQGRIQQGELPDRPAWFRPFQGARKTRHAGRP